MFPRLPARATFVADTNFVSRTQKMFLILFRNILCPQQMFPSLRSPRNIMSNNVSSFVSSSKRFLYDNPAPTPLSIPLTEAFLQACNQYVTSRANRVSMKEFSFSWKQYYIHIQDTTYHVFNFNDIFKEYCNSKIMWTSS